MREAARSFDAWFEGATGAPWWLLTVVLFAVGMTYRVYRVLTAEQREAVRRHQLLSELREFIGGSQRANVERARALYEEKMRKHARLYVRSFDVSALKEVSGIGPATVQALQQAGYESLQDVQDNDIRGVRMIGQAKYQSALAYMARAEHAAYQGLMEGSDDVPLEPETEAVYSLAIEKLGVRNQRLEEDRDGLQPADDELAKYEADIATRTNETRLREWLESPLRELRADPMRPARFGLLALLFTLICGALPLVALGTGTNADLASAASWSFRAAFFAAHFYFAVYVFASERAVRLGSSALDPHNYQEQRLQFLGLMMALKRGIAPPEVRVSDATFTETRGHRAGPSLIVLPSTQVKRLSRDASQEAVEFALAHEVGRLSSDQLRIATTAGTLVAPFAWVAHAAVRLLALVLSGFGVGYGWVGLIVLSCVLIPAVWVLPIAMVLVCLYMAVAVTQVLVSNDAVFEADRVGRELTSIEAMKETLACLANMDRVDGARAQMGEDHLSNELLVLDSPKKLSGRVAAFANGIVDRVVHAAPSYRRRLRMLDRPSASAVDLALGLTRTVLILAMAFGGVRAAVAQRDFLRTLGSGTPSQLAQTRVGPQTAPALPTVVAPGRTMRRVTVRGQTETCSVRSSPSRSAPVVGSVRTDEYCAVLPHDAAWFDVECDGVVGFMGRGCIAP